MAQETRSSRWATIVYPESAPEDFLQILRDFHISFLCSPLHDRDTNKDGSPKKPHFHLMLYFDSLKSSKQVKEIFSSLGGVGCEKVASATSYARYLCHLDESDKPHYSTDDVQAYGLDYAECAKGADYKYEGISALIDFILEHHVSSFWQLFLLLRQHEDKTLFKIVCDNAYLVRSFLSSMHQDCIDAEKRGFPTPYEAMQNLEDDVPRETTPETKSHIDLETGEILEDDVPRETIPETKSLL